MPVHSATIWYYFGGITLFLFTIQVMTGVLLLLYYRPSPTEAYESVQFIVTRVQFGWLVRSIHSWSANLMILTAFIHMFSVVFLHAYRRPRELTWLSGIALLGLALAFGFSGYLLPWNKVSYFATKVGTDMAASVPLVGEHLARFLRGGDDVGGATLTRFFGFHVAVLPGITTLLLLVHLGLVQQHGMSSPPWIKGNESAADEVLPELLPARTDGLVRGAGGAGVSRGAVPVGAGRKGGSVRFGSRGHPAGVVFSGALLHAEADSQPRVEDRGRTAGPARLRSAGGVVGGAALLGGHPRRHGARPRWVTGAGVAAAGLPGHVLRYWGTGDEAHCTAASAARWPSRSALRLPRTPASSATANLDGNLKAPATTFSNDIHARHGFSCADCHGGDRNADDHGSLHEPRQGLHRQDRAHRRARSSARAAIATPT